MKKFFSVLICLIVIMSCLFLNTFSEDDISNNYNIKLVNTIINDGKPLFYIDNVFSTFGDELVVPIMIYNNPGIIAAAVDIFYDSDILEIIDTVYGDVFSVENTTFGNNKTFNPYRVFWNDALSYVNNTSDGVLCTIRFRVKSYAGENQTVIRIEYDPNSTFNVNLDNVAFDIHNSVVTLSSLKSRGKAVIDYNESVIYGLDYEINSLDDYVYTDNSELSIVYNNSAKEFGTGTEVLLVDGNNTVEKFSVIIFGDLNGDGLCNGKDAVILNCIKNGVFGANDFDKSVYFAADCNHNGVIDSADSELIEESGLFKTQINQK